MNVRAWLCAALMLVACRRDTKSPVREAEFGVFFGGQVQELKTIGKQLDPARQRHGFRITFAAPLERSVKVSWEISLPVTDKSLPRAALVGETLAKVGETQLDVPFTFRPSDPLGEWHARVFVDGRAVIERDFSVVAPGR